MSRQQSWGRSPDPAAASHGGQGNEAGSLYRRGVAAYLAAHGLAGRGVEAAGFPETGPAPVRLSFETGEAVDDIRCELSDGTVLRVQAKLECGNDRHLAATVAQWVRQADSLRPGDMIGLATSRPKGPVRELGSALHRGRRSVPGSYSARERSALTAVRKQLPAGTPDEVTDLVLQAAIVMTVAVSTPHEEGFRSVANLLDGTVVASGFGSAAIGALQDAFQKQAAAGAGSNLDDWLEILEEARLPVLRAKLRATTTRHAGLAHRDGALVRPEYTLEPFKPIVRQHIPKSQRSPSHLLDAARQVVPFHARAEQRPLAAWLACGEPVSVILVSGPGGYGKTRLAGQLAVDAAKDGWEVLRATYKSGPARTDDAILPVPRASRLVIIDYADRWPLPVLTGLVSELADECSDRELRVLLLARPQRDFWETTRAELGRAGTDLPDPINLTEFTAPGDETERAYDTAVLAFQRQLDYPPHKLPLSSGMRAHDPLSLHMSALAAICAHAEHEPPPHERDLSSYLLDHERRYWNTRGAADRTVESAAFTATLFGPFGSDSEARRWVRLARLADGDAEATRLLDTYRRLYPPSAHGEVLLPLGPDRLAEDFVAAQLADSSRRELVTELFANVDLGSDQTAVRRCLDVLAAASRYPQVRSVLFGILRTHSELAPLATAPVLYAVLEQGDRPLVEMVHTALPFRGAELLPPARDFARHLLDTLPADAPSWKRASLLVSLGRRTEDAGDRREARVVTHEAVAACRNLVDADPRHLPLLAVALNDLGQVLNRAGDHQAALNAAREASDHIEQVAATDPAAADPLATTAVQSNLGNILADVGDKPAALAAATRHAEAILQATEAGPVSPVILAHCLREIAQRLADMGEKSIAPKAARTAVRTYLQLAQANPAAFLPDAAGALWTQAIVLVRCHDVNGAIASMAESVEGYTILADCDPGAFGSRLAQASQTLRGLHWIAEQLTVRHTPLVPPSEPCPEAEGTV